VENPWTLFTLCATEIRDGIQNHALQDVSSKSYYRWTYMPEKRAGMEKWNTFVTSLLQTNPRISWFFECNCGSTESPTNANVLSGLLPIAE